MVRELPTHQFAGDAIVIGDLVKFIPTDDWSADRGPEFGGGGK
jgi:hypothetical protein